MRPRAAMRALSLVELMIAVAVLAVIISLAAPSFSEYIVTQRVRSVHAQLATDLQFARSEAVARSKFVGIRFQHKTGTEGQSCYVIFTRPDPSITPAATCDCLAAPGSRCESHPTETQEVRTVTISNDLRVTLRVAADQTDNLTFDPRTGALKTSASDFKSVSASGFQINTAADTPRTLRAVIATSGRAELCSPSGSSMGGVACKL